MKAVACTERLKHKALAEVEVVKASGLNKRTLAEVANLLLPLLVHKTINAPAALNLRFDDYSGGLWLLREYRILISFTHHPSCL